MAAATPYYRIPVVIFAVLVGGLYVYAKGGGSLLQNRTQVTPARNTQGEELAPPRIEFMMGPKSAPAFDQPSQQQRVQPAPVQQAPRQVLPGSKSRAVIDPPTYVPVKPAPNAEPVNVVPNQTRLLPGSKSVILIDPQIVTPPTNSGVKFPPANAKPPSQTLRAQPVQPAPQQPRTRVLPGSKSAILIEPSTIVPPPTNSANTQHAQPKPAPRQPAYQQPAYQQPAYQKQPAYQRPAQQPSNSYQRSYNNNPAPVER